MCICVWSRTECRREGEIQFTINGSGIFLSVLISNVGGKMGKPTTYRYWLVMWVGRWKVSQGHRLHVIEEREKEYHHDCLLFVNNRSGMSHLLLRLYNRANNFNIFYYGSKTAFISFIKPWLNIFFILVICLLLTFFIYISKIIIVSTTPFFKK